MPDYSKFKSSEEQAALFHVAPFNIDAGRAKLIKRVERAAKQVAGEKAGPGAKDFTVGHHNEIQLRLMLNEQRIYLEGTEEHFPISSTKFADLAKAIIADIEAGEFDDQIEDALSGPSIPQVRPATKSKAKRTAGGALKAAPATYFALKISLGSLVKRSGHSLDEARDLLLSRGADAGEVERAIAEFKG